LVVFPSRMRTNPAWPVYERSTRSPDKLALDADGMHLSYAALARRAHRLVAALKSRGYGPDRRIGILASRSLIAVEAVLAAAWAGITYVPLGARWPTARLETVLRLAEIDAVIADESGAKSLTPSVLERLDLVLVPDEAAARAVRDTRPDLRALALDALPEPSSVEPPADIGNDHLLYIIFTSGTTGTPKGVMVPAAPVAAYLHALQSRKHLTEHDRASQFTELTFDPSLGEIFLPWLAGASLHVVPAISQISPAAFIRDKQLTVWGSAPAAIAWLKQTRSLPPGSFPTLRYSSFGGEPLPLASVRAWQAAAPNSVIDNLYGPTEATVDCCGERIEPGAMPVLTAGRDVVAIGVPHPGTELAVLGPDRRPVPDSTDGELAIAGAQLSLGYLGAPEVTAERFPVLDGKRWYLTGDLARRDATGRLHHLGRLDHQIKIHGHRVELEDIEAHLRAVAGVDHVAAIAWPMVDGVARGIIGFVGGDIDSSGPALRDALRQRIPPYMVPGTIHVLATLPLTTSGKVDRRALLDRLASETGAA
jgi:amino acid adenylation domain-containing protein